MKYIYAAFAFGFCLILSAGQVQAGGSEENTELCKEAAERYKSIEWETPAEPGTVIVQMYKYNFCPKTLTVKAGTKVRWVNVDKRTSHSVWLKEAGLAESDRYFPEELWEHTFDKAGEYPYLCGPHGIEEGMTAHITVTP